MDEAQDMNPYQIHLIEQLFNKGVRTICVGDSNQAIYAFRGAYSDSMERLAGMTDAIELPLSYTYRCREEIVTFTNDEIVGSEMEHVKDGGTVEEIPKEDFVARIKADNIKMIIGAKNKSLVRAWLMLAKEKIASTLKGTGITKEIRRVIEDNGAAPKTTKRGTIPAKISIEELEEVLQESIFAGYMEDESGVEEQTLPTQTVDIYTCVLDIIRMHDIRDYAEFDDLLIEMEQDSDHELHTVHSSKGLEAPSVIVLCDWFNSIQTENMRYVAYTRAEDHLILVEGWEREEDERKGF